MDGGHTPCNFPSETLTCPWMKFDGSDREKEVGGKGGETGRLGHRESRFLPNLLTVGVDVMLISCVL